MGTPACAAPALNSLLRSGETVVGVYTAPDRPKGRGRLEGFSPVKELALERGLPLFQPSSLRSAEARREFSALAPDVAVVAAYGYIIPPGMLRVPPLGFVNVHPSLLPRYRGPSPVVTALLDGVDETGVTLILLDEGLDSGPILARRSARVAPGETAPALTMRLFELGADLLAGTLPRWRDGQLAAEAQDDSLATFTRKIVKTDGLVDWTEDAETLCRRYRAFTPWPGFFTQWRGETLKLLDVSPAPSGAGGTPGRVVDLGDGVGVVAGDGRPLAVGRLQMEGRRVQKAEEFRRGYPQFVGSLLPS